jgi:hypothetical protein
MSQFEYKVVPAPKKGLKAKGAKTTQDRFAMTLAATMNTLAVDGWEYLRTDTLPSEERSGLLRRVTVYHNILVFRRVVQAGKPANPAPVHTAPDRTPIMAAPTSTPAVTVKPLHADPARPAPQIVTP